MNEHVPARQTGWVRLGTVTASHCPIGIVAADDAASLQQHWQDRRELAWHAADYDERDELLLAGPRQAEEIKVPGYYGYGDGTAVLVSVDSPEIAIIEGRFGDVYRTGHMTLIEIRVRLWTCTCGCHDGPGDGLCCQEEPQT